MSKPSHTAKLGAVGGVDLNVDLLGNSVSGGGDPWALKQVRLTADYTAVNPPGFPDRPPAGVPTASKWKPGVIPNGTTRYFHAHEAAALIAAGAAVAV